MLLALSILGRVGRGRIGFRFRFVFLVECIFKVMEENIVYVHTRWRKIKWGRGRNKGGENARAELAARRATEICHFAKKKTKERKLKAR